VLTYWRRLLEQYRVGQAGPWAKEWKGKRFWACSSMADARKSAIKLL